MQNPLFVFAWVFYECTFYLIIQSGREKKLEAEFLTFAIKFSIHFAFISPSGKFYVRELKNYLMTINALERRVYACRV